MTSSALFSPCRTYRYTLSRRWSSGDRLATFIALNPSTADETQDDPTIRRMIGFARTWGLDGLHVANIFALRSTDPKALRRHRAPIGPDNDWHIMRLARAAEIVVACWGKHGGLADRGPAVLQALKAASVQVQCLAINGDGSPKHPLYLRGDCEPRRM